MGYPIYVDSITLTDGTVIKKTPDGFPPYSEINPGANPCNVCPVRPLCDDNNEFKCSNYGMFDGAYWSFEDVIKMCKTVTAVNEVT